MIGMFGEDTVVMGSSPFCVRYIDLVVCNGKRLVLDPEWTRVRPSLDQMTT